MAALTAAGVVFVPFDSGSFTEVANIAWDGGPESDDYMEPEAIARWAPFMCAFCTVIVLHGCCRCMSNHARIAVS